MGKYRAFDDFVEGKKLDDKPPKKAKVSADVPPQGKNPTPYYGPHAKNDPKPKLRVVEKPANALGDEATPALKKPEDNLPSGKKPSHDHMTIERYIEARNKGKKIKDEYDGKVRVRVTDKVEAGLGDEASPRMEKPDTNLPTGKKPTRKGLTTEEYLRETEELSDSEFIISEVKKTKNDDEDVGPVMHCQRRGIAIVPSSSEAASYMASVIPINDRAVRTLVHEVINTPGALGALIAELAAHNDTYSELVGQMNGPDSRVPRRLVKAMREDYDKFMSDLGLNEAVNAPMDDRDKAADPVPAPAPEGAASPTSEITAGASLMGPEGVPGGPAPAAGPGPGPGPGVILFILSIIFFSDSLWINGKPSFPQEYITE